MKLMKPIAGAVLSTLLCASAFAAGPNVLVVGDSNQPSTALLATGLLSSVSFFDSSIGTPTLSYLEGFDAILSYTDSAPANPMELGNVFKQYVDFGGGLVLNTYAFSSPWNISGGILTSGYAPLVASGGNAELTGSIFKASCRCSRPRLP